nr:hypothetical protein HK105_003963 [Polyrhizophydium stewartii]
MRSELGESASLVDSLSDRGSRMSPSSLVAVDMDGGVTDLDRLVLPDAAAIAAAAAAGARARHPDAESVSGRSASGRSASGRRADAAAATASTLSLSQQRRTSTSSSSREIRQLTEAEVRHLNDLLSGRIEALLAELEETKRQNTTQMDSLNHQNQTLRAALAEAEAKSAALDKQFERDYDEVEESRMRARLIEEDLSMLSRQREEYETKIKVLTEELAVSHAAAAALSPDSARIGELTAQLDEYRTMIDALRQGAHEAHTTIDDLRSAKQVLEETIESMRRDGVTPATVLPPQAALQHDVADLQLALSQHEAAEAELRAQVADLQAQLKSESQDTIKLRTEVARLGDLLASREKALADLEARLKDLESRSASEVESLLAQVKSLQDQIAASPEDALSIASAEIAALRSQVLAHETTIAGHVKHERDLAARIESASRERSSLLSALDSAHVSLASISNNHALETQTLHAQIEQLTKENARLAAAASPLGSLPVSTDAHVLLAESERERNDLTQRLIQLEGQARASTEEHMLVVSNLQNSLQWARKEKEQAIKECEERVAAIVAERDQLVAGLGVAVSLTDAAQAGEQAALHLDELKAVRIELAEARGERDAMHESLAKAHDSLRAQTAAANSYIKELQASVDESAERIQVLTAEIQTLRADAGNAGDSAELARVRSQLAEAVAARDSLAQRLLAADTQSVPDTDDAEALRAELRDAITERDQVKDKLDQLRAKLREIESRSIEDQSHLVDTMRDLTERNAELKTQRDALQQQVSHLSSRPAASVGIPELSAAEAAASPIVEAMLREQREQYQDRIDTLKQRGIDIEDKLATVESTYLKGITEREIELERLRGQVTQLTADLEAAKRERDDSMAAFESLEQQHAIFAQELDVVRQERQDADEHAEKLEAIINSNTEKFHDILAKMQADHDALSEKLASESASHATAFAEAAKRIEHLEQDTVALRAERDEAVALSQSLKDELASLAVHKGAADAASTQVAQLEEQIKERNAQIDALNSDVATAKSLAEQWESYANESLQEAEATHAQEIHVRETAATALKADVAELSERLEASSARVFELEAQLAVQNARVLELEALVDTTRAEITEAADARYESLSQAHQTLQEHSEQLEATITQLRADVTQGSALSHQLEDTRQSLSDALSRLKAVEADLQGAHNRYEHLSAEHQAALERSEVLAQDVSCLQHEAQDRADLARQVENLELLLAQAKSDREVLAAEHADALELVLSRLRDAEARVQHAEHELLALRDEHAYLQQRHQQHVNAQADRDALIAVIEQEKADAEASLAAARQEQERLESQLMAAQRDHSKLMDEIDRLQAQLSEAHATQHETESAHASNVLQLEVDLEAARAEAKRVEAESVELAERVKELSSQVEEAQLAIQEWQDYAASFGAERSAWAAERAELESHAMAVAEQAQQSTGAISGELAALRTEHAQAVEACESAQQRAAQAEERLVEVEAAMRAASESHTAELAQAQIRAEELAIERSALATQIQELQDANALLTQRVEQLDAHAREASESAKKLNTVMGECESLERDYEQAKERLRQLELDLEVARHELDATRHSLTGHEHALAEQTSRADRLEREVEELRYGDNATIQRLQTDKIQLEMQIDDLSTRIGRAEQRASEFELSALQHQQDVREFDAARQELQMRVASLEADIARMAAVHAQETAAYAAESETAMQSMQACISGLNEDNMVLSSELDQTRAKMHETMRELGNVREQLHAIEAQRSADSYEHSQAMEVLKSELESQRTLAREASAEAKSARKTLADRLAEHAALVQDLESRLKTLQETHDRLRGELESLNQNAESAKRSFEQSSEQLAETHAELASLRAERTELASKLDDAERAKAELARKLDEAVDLSSRKEGELDTARAAAQALETKMASLVERHAIEMASLHSSRSNLDISEQALLKERARCKVLETELDSAKTSLAAAHAKAAAAEREVDMQRRQIAAMTSSADSESAARVDRFTKEVLELRTELSGVKAERDALADTLGRKARELDDAIQQVATLKLAEQHAAQTAKTAAVRAVDLGHAAELVRLKGVVADLEGKLAESDQLLCEMQPALDELDETRAEVERMSRMLRDLGAETDAAGRLTLPLHMDGEQPIRHVPAKEYAQMQARAEDVDRCMSQLESTLALLDENDREIETLRATIEAIVTDATSPASVRRPGTAGGDDNVAKMLQRQIEELRKLWSHELSANSVLRNLIAKTQAESHQYQQDTQRQIMRLREEFDELAHLYETCQRDAEQLRREATAAEKRFEERFNSHFHEQQDQLTAQEELHAKERQALNKLISSLEMERDRLAVDLMRLKSRLDDNAFDKTRDYDAAKRRLAEREAALAETEVALRQSELRARDAEYRLRDMEAKIKEIDLGHKDVVTEFEMRLREADTHIAHLEAKIKEADFAIAKSQADLGRTAQEAKFMADRYRVMEDAYRKLAAAPSHMHRTHEEVEAYRQAWLAERAQLEAELKRKQMELLDREQESMEERMRLRAVADEEIRNAVSAEQRHSRELLGTRIDEMRTRYEAALDELRAQKRKVEEQLDDTEHTLLEERDQLQRRLFEVEERERVLQEENKALESRARAARRTSKQDEERPGADAALDGPLRWGSERRELERRFAQREQQLESERRGLENRLREVSAQLRAMELRLEQSDASCQQERARFEQELERVRLESAQISQHLHSADANGLVEALNQQKNNLEALLRERDEQLSALEERVRQLVVSSGEATEGARALEAQKASLESLIVDRDRRLADAQAQVHSLTARLDQIANMPVKDAAGGVGSRSLASARDAQEYLDQIDRLNQKHQQALDEAKRQADVQIKFERDRAKRLAHKIEDLKFRNQQLKKQLEVYSAPVPGSAEAAREEIEMLRLDLANLKSSNGQILAILRETLLQTMGPGAIDIPDADANRVRINLSKLKDQCGSLIQEVVYMRALVNRLLLWRADLKYQKLYLSLKVDDLLESHKTTLSFIHGMGVALDRRDSMETLSPRRKFVRCVNAVIAIQRMKMLAAGWQVFLQENNRGFFEDLRDSGDIGPAALGGAGGRESGAPFHYASTGDGLDNTQPGRRVVDLERELEQARAVRVALEDRLNEEMYEKRAIELENERLMRAIKYERQPLPNPGPLSPLPLGQAAAARDEHHAARYGSTGARTLDSFLQMPQPQAPLTAASGPLGAPASSHDSRWSGSAGARFR